MGHLLMENRNALIVDAVLSQATGTAERDAALLMLDRRKGQRRITLGADKAYDVSAFVDQLHAREVAPHIALDGHLTKTGKRRKTRIDRRTTRHPGYAASQRIRKRIEESFGWIKTTAGLAKTRHRGLDRAGWMFTLTAAAQAADGARTMTAPTDCQLVGCRGPSGGPRPRARRPAPNTARSRAFADPPGDETVLDPKHATNSAAC